MGSVTRKKTKTNYVPYMLIMPTLVLFALFFLIPVIYSFYISLFRWTGFSVEKKFVMFDNYIEIFSDEVFLKALFNNFIYMLGVVPITLILSLIIAMMLNKGIRNVRFFRVSYFMPHIVSMLSVSVVWTWIYSPEKYGLFNWVISFFGIQPQKWLTNVKLAMLSLMIMGIWKWMGYNMILFLAGLKSIPDYLYESAQIDGAGKWVTFKCITLPMLMPTISVQLILSTINSFKLIFDQINTMTNGGPAGSTEVLVTYLYKVGFKQFELGYASSIAYILFLIVMIFTLIQKKFFDKKLNY